MCFTRFIRNKTVIRKMKTFKRIYIEITNICNKNCDFCAKTERLPQIMSVERFKLIISKIKEHTKQVYFHVMGEPLIHENVGECLDICEQNGLSVNLNTNGALLKSKLDSLLGKKSLRKIVISLHSFGANKLGDLAEYLSEITESAKKLSAYCYVELRLWALNDKTLSDLDRKIVDYLCDVFRFGDAVNPAKTKQYTLAKNVFLDFGNQFVWPSENPNTFTNGFCYALRTQIAVLVNGDVVPCCLDNNGKMVLGNLFNCDLETIVNGERAVNIYNGFSKRQKTEELCLHCNYLAVKND